MSDLLGYNPGPRGVTFGTIIDQQPTPRQVVAIASPVYPKGSPAYQQQILGHQHGHATYRFFLVGLDGSESTILLHRGNSVAVRRSF